jgi:hypothetical protein
MNKYIIKILAATLISITGSSWAVEHPADIHHHGKMVFEGFGPVNKTYGYLNIVTNEEGKGMINVMFSNGRQTDWVKFNARVTFLDKSGAVITESNVYRWMESAGSEGAAERKITTPLKVSEFDAIEVEFYLTETEDTVATMPVYQSELAYKEITSL